MGEFLMILGLLSLGLIVIHPMTGMVLAAVLMIVGGNIACSTK